MKPLALVSCVCLAGVVAAPTAALAQDPLDPARQLYAAADYEGVLDALDKANVDHDPARAIEADTYRVLCLVALGRSDEADTVIEEILTTDPLYEVSAADAPPRIRAAFSRARKRVLPQVAREAYAAGKAAYDEKAYHRAATKLEETLRLVDGAEAKGEAELADLDLRTLAKGFLELSIAAMKAPATPPPAPAATAAPSAAPVIPVRPDSDPVALEQVLPPWSTTTVGAMSQVEFRGTIAVDIDETGKVVGAEITKPIHPMYDAALLRASRNWKYEPGYRGGKPMRMRKVVEVVLRPR